MKIIQPEPYQRFEIVVIGSGPGGSVTAATLAGAGRNVLLIEEGADLPQDSCRPFTFQEMQQKYRAAGITAALGKPGVVYAEGACVGGGSEVGNGIYNRMPAELMESWATDYEVEFFSQAALEPHFADCEQIMQPRVYPATLPRASQLLRQGAAKRGMSSLDVPRLVDFSPELDEQGVPVSRRRSMSATYLPLFLRNAGNLLANTRVQKLARHRSGWEVHAVHNGSRPLLIRADKVFVCAGAVHTPALLQRSGIHRNVGRTLAMQPMVTLTAEFAEPVSFPGMGVAAEQVDEFSPDFYFGCAPSSRAQLAINLANERGGVDLAVNRHRHLVSFYVMSRGSLNGYVRALPGLNDPLVRYKISQRERDNLGKGIKALTRLLLAAKAARVFTGLPANRIIDSFSQTDGLDNTLPAGFNNITTMHLMSSCPMGEDQRKAAVNSWGRVHGHAGLYVTDVSTLCTSPGVDPQGTIMALARRNSEHFLRV